MRWGVDSQEDMSRHTVKTSSVRAVNTSIDTAVGKTAHAVNVFSVSVNNECRGNAGINIALKIYIDRSSCVLPLKAMTSAVQPRSIITQTAPIPLFFSTALKSL